MLFGAFHDTPVMIYLLISPPCIVSDSFLHLMWDDLDVNSNSGLSCTNLTKNKVNQNWQYVHLFIIQWITIIIIIKRDKLTCSVLFEHRRFDSSYASQTIWQSCWDFSISFSLPALHRKQIEMKIGKLNLTMMLGWNDSMHRHMYIHR